MTSIADPQYEEASRQQFEAVLRRNNSAVDLSRDEVGYVAPEVQQSWFVWQQACSWQAFSGGLVPAFGHVANIKLKTLQERGYQITGYAFERSVNGSKPERGFINHGGFVGWWSGQH